MYIHSAWSREDPPKKDAWQFRLQSTSLNFISELRVEGDLYKEMNHIDNSKY